MLIDARGVMVDGSCVTLKVFADSEADVSDYECYSEEDISAWQAGEWRFVGVALEASPDNTSTLCGVEYGAFPGRTPITLDTIISEVYMTVDGIDYTMPQTLMSEIRERG